MALPAYFTRQNAGVQGLGGDKRKERTARPGVPQVGVGLLAYLSKYLAQPA